MKCNKCGAENFDGADRCMDCGASLGEIKAPEGMQVGTPPADSGGGPSRSTITIAAVAVAAVLVVVGLMFAAGGGSGGGGGGGGVRGSIVATGSVGASSTAAPEAAVYNSTVVTEPVSASDRQAAMAIAAPLVSQSRPEFVNATSTVTAYSSQGSRFLAVTYARALTVTNPDGSVTRTPQVLVVTVDRASGAVMLGATN